MGKRFLLFGKRSVGTQLKQKHLLIIFLCQLFGDFVIGKSRILYEQGVVVVVARPGVIEPRVVVIAVVLILVGSAWMRLF